MVSVHELRPSDINVIAALGDSITVSNYVLKNLTASLIYAALSNNNCGILRMFCGVEVETTLHIQRIRFAQSTFPLHFQAGYGLGAESVVEVLVKNRGESWRCVLETNQ